MNDALDKKQSIIDKMTGDLNAAHQRLSRVSPKRGADLATNSADGEIAWNEAMQRCGGDYVAARKQYPKTFQNFFKKSQE